MDKNWKTTAFGVGFGALNLFLSAWSGGLKPKDAAISVGLAVLGTLAKDRDMTGGTRSATPEASERVWQDEKKAGMVPPLSPAEPHAFIAGVMGRCIVCGQTLEGNVKHF